MKIKNYAVFVGEINTLNKIKDKFNSIPKTLLYDDSYYKLEYDSKTYHKLFESDMSNYNFENHAPEWFHPEVPSFVCIYEDEDYHDDAPSFEDGLAIEGISSSPISKLVEMISKEYNVEARLHYNLFDDDDYDETEGWQHFELIKNKIILTKIQQDFTLCNILHVTLEHNGYQGGDAGHGGYVKMNFNNEGAAIQVNGEECEEVELIFRGDDERLTLVDALKMIVKELEE
jgi:hypothetical protein